MTIEPSLRPRLARRARVRWDESRKTHVLLYPEGVILLTEHAADVLSRCDGGRSVDAIVSELCAAYPDAERETVAADVRELLERLVARGFIKTDGAP